MPHLRASVTGSSAGFDRSRNLLVMPIGGIVDLYLVAGSNLSGSVEDTGIAAADERGVSKTEQSSPKLDQWERTNGIRAFRFKGKTLGNTVFTAVQPGTSIDCIAPLTVRVTADKDHRQAGDGAKGEAYVSPELRMELAGMSFRDALVRLAEDQMNSVIGRSSDGGFGCYGLPATDSEGHKLNWCGAFVHWLYKRVAEVKGQDSPFGTDVNTLASPQKAIGYALHRPDDLAILRFTGTDPYGWSWPRKRDAHGKEVGDHPPLQAEYEEVTLQSGPPITGDVCLVRVSNDPAKGWKHVSMVLTPPDSEGNFWTFDGNRGGSYNPDTGLGGTIGTGQHNVFEMAKSGSVGKYVFIHTALSEPRKYQPSVLVEQLSTKR